MPTLTRLLNMGRLARERGILGAFTVLRERLFIRNFERRLGIDSETIVGVEELGLDGKVSRPYVPTSYRVLERAFDLLDVKPTDVFLDFGSGMGRVLIMAAQYPFKRVLGVEFAESLNEVARRNIERSKSKNACKDVEVTTSNAIDYKIPADVTVVFFFNPFSGHILERVMANLRSSLRDDPRELTVVAYFPRKSGFSEIISAQDWLRQIHDISFGADTLSVFVASHHVPGS